MILNKALRESNKEIPLIQLNVNESKDGIPFFLEVYGILAVVWMELVFHFVRFGFSGENILIKCIFGCFFGILLGGIFGLIPRLGAIIGFSIGLFVVTFYYLVQIVYSGVFATFLSLSGSVGMTGQAFDFKDVIWKEITHEWWVILLTLVPFLLFVFLGRKFVSGRHNVKQIGIVVAAEICVYLLSMISIRVDQTKLYNAYEVYKNYTSVDMAVQKLGVFEAFWVDTKYAVMDKLNLGSHSVDFVAEITEATTEISTTEFAHNTTELSTEAITTEVVIDTSPNVLPIDLDALVESEKNANIAAIHNYVKTVPPTNKNEYTGMFKDYNVIFIVAEGFSGYVVDPERTPMLYQMIHEGFYFTNYYTPLWYGSTLGGEYADLTGLMPRDGGYLSMERTGMKKNDMLFTLGVQLKKEGYTVNGYHDNEYTYYNRHISHPNMGYNWVGVGNGYVPERSGNTILWPQSDYHMMETTFDLYKDEEPFHTYYLTVSGHVMYNFTGNAMAMKHKNLVENLNYSETTKAYIACQYELEYAMESLVSNLEYEGLLDHTLIILTADHVPYDNKEVLDELAGHTLDSTFEWYENSLIIWSGSMEKPIRVDKPCSSLDILPTVSNLLGLPYDSRMMVGQDILSDSEGMVYFNDRSFITDHCSYNANSGEVKSLDGKPVDDAYVDAKNAQVKNKFSMAESICYYDYYRYIDDALNEDKEDD